MKGATLFSGILAPELAAPDIDWLWCAEIDREASGVIAHRRPGHANLGDVTAPDFIERAKSYGSIDLLVFGSPCQSFSVAGRRLGLDDPRGNLALHALGIVAQLRPSWFVFENVPGLFSSWSDSETEGVETSDFASWLQSVDECGYHVAWRVLDAQYAGVPQRRRRIFAVGHSRAWTHPAAVLLIPESLRRNHKKSSEARPGSSRPANASARLRRLWESLVRSFGEGTESYPPRSSEAVRNGSVAVNCRDYKVEGEKTGTLQVPGQGGWSLSSQNAVLEPKAVDFRNDKMVGEVAGTIQSKDTGGWSLNYQSSILEPVVSHDVSPAVLHRGHKGQDTYMTLPMVAHREVAPALTGNYGKQPDNSDTDLGPNLIAHTLRGEGFDASEDGTGRGIPLVYPTLLSNGTGVGRTGNTFREHEQYIPEIADPVTTKEGKTYTHEGNTFRMHNCLTAPPPVGFYGNLGSQGGGVEIDQTPPLKAGSHENLTAVAFQNTGHGWWNQSEVGATVRTPDGGGSQEANVVAFDTTNLTSKENRSDPKPGDPCHTLAGSAHPPAVAFHCNMGGNDGGVHDDGTAPTVTTERKPAIAFQERTREKGEVKHLDYQEDLAYALNAPDGGGRRQEMNVCVPDSVSFSLRGREDGRQAEPDEDGVASSLRAANGGSSRSFVAFDPFSPTSSGDTTQTVRASEGGGSHDNLVAGPQPAAFDIYNQHLDGDITQTLCKGARNEMPALIEPIAFDAYNQQETGDVSQTIRRGNGNPTGGAMPALLQNWAVRRLTPVETERLQGFPDHWTLVPWRGGMMADGPRYRMIGNSMAIPCMKWVLERILFVDGIGGES